MLDIKGKRTETAGKYSRATGRGLTEGRTVAVEPIRIIWVSEIKCLMYHYFLPYCNWISYFRGPTHLQRVGNRVESWKIIHSCPGLGKFNGVGARYFRLKYQVTPLNFPSSGLGLNNRSIVDLDQKTLITMLLRYTFSMKRDVSLCWWQRIKSFHQTQCKIMSQSNKMDDR